MIHCFEWHCDTFTELLQFVLVYLCLIDDVQFLIYPKLDMNITCFIFNVQNYQYGAQNFKECSEFHIYHLNINIEI